MKMTYSVTALELILRNNVSKTDAETLTMLGEICSLALQIIFTIRLSWMLDSAALRSRTRFVFELVQIDHQSLNLRAANESLLK